MKENVVVLGAGFGGLELTTLLSEAMGDEIRVTLIDGNDSFVFGFSKLDFMFGRTTPEAVRHPYRDLEKPGVTFRQERITAIDPETRRVTTDRGTLDADILVIALGAVYDFDATPGLLEAGHEFYSVPGAERVMKVLPRITEGHILIGVCGAPYKCPPAPSEFALLLHDDLVRRGVRDRCRISFSIPFNSPVPPSPETSEALRQAFAERDIELLAGHKISSFDPERKMTVLDDGTELGFDHFFGVPKHRAPDVVIESGMTENGYIPVESATLKSRYPRVFSIGDVTTAGVPKAGVFSIGAAREVAGELIAGWRGEKAPPPYDGRGSCYIEFGGGRVGRVDIDFLSGPEKTGVYQAPSHAYAIEKDQFAADLLNRWFAPAPPNGY